MSGDARKNHEAKTPTLFEQAWEIRQEWASKQPPLGAQLAAMWREAIKDIRQTLMESYFGKGEHMPEAGTPMNPTQQQVSVEQGFHGYQEAQRDAAARAVAVEREEGHTR